MAVTGIITEYNPFHNGHLYHLQQSRQLSQGRGVICVLNGNFVQRGRPAVFNKWARTRMAIAGGVDLVIELPLIYGIRSAEYFARGAVGLLEATGIVDTLVFGSEAGTIEPLNSLAEILLAEGPDLRKRLKKELHRGLPYPAAREKALAGYLASHPTPHPLQTDLKEIISSPNNILGIEYIKALKEINSTIKPVTIKRQKSNYHSMELSSMFASATAIRQRLKIGSLADVKPFIPGSCWQVMEKEFEEGRAPIEEEALTTMVFSQLRRLNAGELTRFAEIDNGLENRITAAAHKSGSFSHLVEQIKTRAFTWTRIQRNLLHILFGLDRQTFNQLDKQGPAYLRVLGFNNRGESLIARIMEKSTLPVIIQPADFLNQLELASSDPLLQSLSYDLMASDLYTLLYPEPAERSGHLDFTTPLIRE